VCGRAPHAKGLRHLPSKRFQARFLAPGGRRRTETFQTAKDAERWLHHQFSDISDGTYSTSAAETVAVSFAVYAERWLSNRKVKGRPLAARTVSGYNDLLRRFILPTFGHLPLHTITREQVEAWYDHTAVDRPTYRTRAYSLLRSILGSAVDDDYLALNPARIRGAGQTDRRHQVRPATLDELVSLTEAMPPRYRLLVQLAGWCALRFGELTELRRGDVDTRDGVLRVRRAVVLVDGIFVVKDRKSHAGVRDVVIPPHLMPMVRAHLLEHTAPGQEGLLFPSRHDPAAHMRQSALTRVYYPARVAASRPDLRFHDLRHTGAVLAVVRRVASDATAESIRRIA
jgi:integrase